MKTSFMVSFFLFVSLFSSFAFGQEEEEPLCYKGEPCCEAAASQQGELCDTATKVVVAPETHQEALGPPDSGCCIDEGLVESLIDMIDRLNESVVELSESERKLGDKLDSFEPVVRLEPAVYEAAAPISSAYPGAWSISTVLRAEVALGGGDTENPWFLHQTASMRWLSRNPSLYWGFEATAGGGVWFVEGTAVVSTVGSAAFVFGGDLLVSVGVTTRWSKSPFEGDGAYLANSVDLGVIYTSKLFTARLGVGAPTYSELKMTSAPFFSAGVGFDFDL